MWIIKLIIFFFPFDWKIDDQGWPTSKSHWEAEENVNLMKSAVLIDE